MSLKTRLRVAIVLLVITVVVALSAVNLHGLAEAAFRDAVDRSQNAAQQVKSFVLQRISERTASHTPPPATIEESKALWADIVAHDEEISTLLEKTMANSSAIVEIQVAGESGRVLVSSNPTRIGATTTSLPNFAAWHRKALWRKLSEVLTFSQDYETAVLLGIPNDPRPLFTIRVIASSVLLRNAILPELRNLAVVSLVALLASVLLAGLFSNVALRPLASIGQTIDRIARGEFSEEPHADRSKEVAAVQSKLTLLGQQFRGAREDALELRGSIEQLLQRLEEAILLFDRSGRLVMAGSAAERFLGRGRWELMGQSLKDVFPAGTDLGAAIHSALELRRPLRDHPAVVERAGAAPARLLVNVELLEGFPSGGERVGTLVTLRDAEPRRQLQSQLDISTRLAAISRLTGGVAHEIKNPLNAIALHLEVLRTRLDSLDAGVDREIDVIAGEIRRLDRVVKTFLDFTRPLELRLAPVNLGELAREVAALVEQEARRGGVIVGFEMEPEPVVIRGDRDLLKQAILNVVANGVEAMSSGGRLTIRVSRGQGQAVLAVSDQGPGIPPEVGEKIFNLYFSTKQGGTGIGLAVTFRVVQLHNGTIDFTSQPGRGTTFQFRFPEWQGEP